MLLRLGFARPQVPVNLASFQCRQVGVAPVSSAVDAAGHPGAFRRGGGDWQRRNQKLRRGGAVRSDDAVGITLSPASLTVNEESGASHTAVLSAQPSGDVTVTIAGHSGTGISINPATPLAFISSNWNTAQRVTVSAADDTDTNNEVTVKGGDIMDHCGGEKVSHLEPLVSINVRTNCSREMSAPTAEVADVAGEAERLLGESYASSGSSEAGDAAFSRLRLSR